MTPWPLKACEMNTSAGTSITFALLTAVISLSFLYTGNQHLLYALATFSSIAAVLLTFYIRSGFSSSFGIAGSALVFFFLWTAVAVSWSKAPHASLVELGSLGTGAAVYLSMRLHPASWVHRNVDRLLIALGIVVGTHIALQAATGVTPESRFLNPNSAAGYLNLIWPTVAIGFLLTERPDRSRFLYAAVILLSLFAVGLTGSRGAMLAALAALAVLALAGTVVLHKPRLSLFLIAVASIGLGSANLVGGGEVAASVQSMTDPGNAGATRFAIWSATWEMIKDHPWFGFGPGVFYLAYPAVRLASDRSAGYFVHNDYLEFWFDRGIIGLILFLAIGLAVLYLSVRLFRDTAKGSVSLSDAAPGIAAVAGLVTLGVHGLFSYSFQMMPFLVLAGIRLAQLEHAVPSAPACRITLPNIRRRPISVFGLTVLLGVAGWSLGSYALYFERVEDGQRETQVGNYAAAANSFARARAIWSQNDSAWYLQANVHYMALQSRPSISTTNRRHLVERALELLDGAEARNTLQPAVPLLRGLFRANYPELARGSPVDSFQKALTLNPHTIEARYALSQLLEQEGRVDAAIKIAREGLAQTYPPGTDISPLRRRMRQLEDGESTSTKGGKLLPSNREAVAPDTGA